MADKLVAAQYQFPPQPDPQCRRALSKSDDEQK
jgi:hypothetical protein